MLNAQSVLSRLKGSEESPQGGFDWPLADQAEAFLRQQIAQVTERNTIARDLERRMLQETGTDLFEWVDHLVLPGNAACELLRTGFEPDAEVDAPAGAHVWEHPAATLSRVLTRDTAGGEMVLALRPERLADFIARQQLSGGPTGEPLSRYRMIEFGRLHGTALQAVERRAYRGFIPAALEPGELAAVLQARELWRTRKRHFEDAGEGFRAGSQVLDRVVRLVGKDVACHYFFEEERAYWQSRNRAGRIQKHRQDQLGLGWGNHDHHTFRCSRQDFVDLVTFLERLGLQKRERFYAGAEAGWGAQVMEQPVAGIVVFADVDLLPEETALDFSSRRLPPAARLGTVGLWVALHGESFLDAGMHHLEARFDFEKLRTQLAQEGIKTMAPFSDFPFLRQAFTEGERWAVNPARLNRLLTSGLISEAQHAQFLAEGALGSHLENLQRHGGFKGFNQKSVSAVIAATDPRRSHFAPEPA